MMNRLQSHKTFQRSKSSKLFLLSQNHVSKNLDGDDGIDAIASYELVQEIEIQYTR